MDHLSLESLKIVNSYDAIHIEGSGSDLCDGVQVLACELSTNSHYAVYFTSATNLTVANCDIHDNTYNGIYGGGSGVIRDNRVYRTDYYEAIRVWGGPLLVEGNQVFQNDSTGIAGTTLVTCKGNTVFSNGTDGIFVEGSASEAGENRVFLNNGSGIAAQSGANARRNVVYSNKGHGIYVDGYQGDFRVIANNLCYNNGDAADEYNIMLSANYWQGKQALIENNTCYGGNGIYIGNPIAVTNRNNIIWATGAGRYALVRYSHMDRYPDGFMESDYNNILVTDGATFSAWLGNQNDLLEWRKATGYDVHSCSTDPFFVNPAGVDGVLGGTNGLDDNFHLASTVGSYKGLPYTALTIAGFTADGTHSRCIDAGLPTSAIKAEQAPNGGRINLGAFGGTTDASLSSGTLGVELGLIGGGPVLRGTVPIYWWTHGPWLSGDTVLLEYSSNGGGSWSGIPGATALPFANGVFAWNTSALTPGSNYKVRATPNAGGTPSVSGLLRVLANTGTTFYVNDSSTTNDVYCTAIGSDANDGLTPATPMANLKRLIVTYKLMPGDTVRIDTGLWTLDSTINLLESGAPGQPIVFLGSPNGTIFNRNDTGQNAIQIAQNDYVRLERLKIQGASSAIVISGVVGNLCDGIEVVNCEIYQNSGRGVSFTLATNLNLVNNLVHDNQQGIGGDGVGVISGNEFHHMSYWVMDLSGPLLVDGNYLHNTRGSIRGSAGVQVIGNTVREGQSTGYSDYIAAIQLSGATCTAISNTVYLCDATGMYVSGGITRRNVVYSNGCLLYTSPSPRDRTRSRMPSSA